nr:late embryogenesis abundant protein LEA74 [Pinus tabuliformis]
MAKFVPPNKLSASLRCLLGDIGGTHTWEQRSYTTSVGEAATSSPREGVIAEVASHQQCKAAEVKEEAQRKNKVFWMRDPATGNWIPEDHFGDIDIAELRAKVLSSSKQKMTYNRR